MLRPRVTYANVVSSLALFLALGGVGWAATSLPRNSVGKAQLRNDAVTASKIRNGAVGVKDLSSSARKALKGATGPAGPAGPAGASGTSTAAGVPDGYSKAEADGRFAARGDTLYGRLVNPVNDDDGTVLSVPGVAEVVPLNCQAANANVQISNLGSGTDVFLANGSNYSGTNWAATSTTFAQTSSDRVVIGSTDGSRVVELSVYARATGSTCVYEAIARITRSAS